MLHQECACVCSVTTDRSEKGRCRLAAGTVPGGVPASPLVSPSPTRELQSLCARGVEPVLTCQSAHGS